MFDVLVNTSLQFRCDQMMNPNLLLFSSDHASLQTVAFL